MTPSELQEAVARAIYESCRNFPKWDDKCDGFWGEAVRERYRRKASAAISVVLDAAVAVCRERAEEYRESMEAAAHKLDRRAFGQCSGASTLCADAISALRPESGEGEK